MRKILMISYDFPPIANSGVFRIVKSAKFLYQFGWKPLILTVKNPDKYMAKIDANFLTDKLDYVKVFRAYSVPFGWITKAGRLGINYKWLVTPDPFIGWLPSAITLGKKIVLKEKVDIIYATSPPATNLLIGLILKKITKKPLVVEYRDLWVGNPFSRYPTKLHLDIEKKLEETVLNNSNTIIALGSLERKRLMAIYPFLDEAKIFLIPNGYDPEDFVSTKPYKFEKLTILHAGTIYARRFEYLKIFLEALRQICKEDDVDLQLIILGKSPPNIKRKLSRIIRELGLDSIVQMLKIKPYKESLRLIMGANILLLIPGGPINITTKIFDYFASKKFIFNIADLRSETARLISDAKAGVTVQPNRNAIYKVLHGILQTSNYDSHIDAQVLKQYSRLEETRKLADILNQMIEN